MPKHHQGGVVIVASFFIALILTILPLPTWAQAFRPEWITLVLIYWCMALPTRVNIGWGWIAGLMLDVTLGNLLGLHALTMSLVAFLTIKLYQRIRVYPPGQQALAILVLVAMSQLLVLWIRGIIGTTPGSWTYWLPSISSAIIWPWLFVVMRGARRHFRVA